jgi:predicted DNA-binding antitoxin AbrB/MazE fold protein
MSYIITVTYGANGIVSPEKEVEVKEGADQEFKIVPNKGYTLNKLLVDRSPAKLDGDIYTFVKVTNNHTLDVTFINAIDGSKPVMVSELTASTNVVFKNLNVIVTPKAKASGGFVVCPRCGATFGNIIYVPGTDNVKCLMCNWTSGAIGISKDPLKEIQEKLVIAKPIKPTEIAVDQQPIEDKPPIEDQPKEIVEP